MPQTSSVNFPPEFQPLVDALVQGSLASYNAPFPQYTGERVAPFSPYQQRAFSAFDALQGDPRYASMFNQSRNMLMGSTAAPMQRLAAMPVGSREVRSEDITSRMSPYTSQVIDASMADLNKQIERARARTSARQAGIRGRGGPGTELGEGSWTPFLELEEAGLRAGNQLSSSLRNQGYESARNQINTDLARLLQAGSTNQAAGLRAAEANQRGTLQGRALGRQGALDLANLGLAERGMRMGDINAMLGIGGMQQQQAQRPLDMAYQTFERSIPWHQNKVGNLANVLYGNPIKTETKEGVASPWTTGLGLGLGALGIGAKAGAFNGMGNWLGGLFGGGSPGVSNINSALSGMSGTPWADGGYIGYDDGGFVDDDDAPLIGAFDALDWDPWEQPELYGESGEDTVAGGDGEDTLTADRPFASISPELRTSFADTLPTALTAGEDIGASLALPASRASLSSQMPVSAWKPEDLVRLVEGMKYEAIQPKTDWGDLALSAAASILTNADKGGMTAIGAGLGAANQSLRDSKREALAQAALQQKANAAQAQIVGRQVAEDNKLRGQALTTEYTTNAAGERTDKQITAQDARSKALREAQERIAKVQADAREKAARIAASKDPDAVKAALAMGHKKGTPGFSEFVLKAFNKDKDSGKEEQIKRIKAAYNVDDKTAVGIADGVLRAIVSPTTGQTEIVNLATNEIVRPNLPASAQTETQTAEKPALSLWDAAELGTGAWSAVKEGVARIAPQILPGDMPIPQETVEARQLLKSATQDLISALQNNPRFAEGEAKRIAKQIDVDPGVLDSTPAMRGRMVSIDKYLRSRLESERRAAKDQNLPSETRKAAASSAEAIGRYLDLLGVPQEQGMVPKGAAPALAPAGRASQQIPTFASPDDPDLAALPSGSQFYDDAGKLRKKP